MILEQLPQHIPELQKLVIAGRLTEIARAQFGCLIAVLNSVRRTDDENRNGFIFVDGAKPAEHLETVTLREIDIEEQYVRDGSVGIFLRLFDKIDRSLSVSRNVDLQWQILNPDHFANEQSVWKIIFSQQKVQPRRNGLCACFGGR